MTEKKRLEKQRAEIRAAGGLRQWFARQRVESRLKAAFKPTQRPARVRIKDEA